MGNKGVGGGEVGCLASTPREAVSVPKGFVPQHHISSPESSCPHAQERGESWKVLYTGGAPLALDS